MHKTISTSIGELTLVADESGAITRVDFGSRAAAADRTAGADGSGAGEADGSGAGEADGSGAAAPAAHGIGGADGSGAGEAAGPDTARATAAATALDTAAAQLREYFAGERTAFDLPLRPLGNAFEQRVWDELLRIPYGETASYGEIARRIGYPDAARAVGRANARNPIPIVVPCHRVIGSDGSLTGYGGGLERKRALLALEAETARW
jgi:methylated-DNA-[protein]-cysteine S-methyltransferase